MNPQHQQYPCFLIKDEHGNVTHVIIHNTDTKEKLIYKIEVVGFEELETLLK
jgi:hypothetical protein